MPHSPQKTCPLIWMLLSPWPTLQAPQVDQIYGLLCVSANTILWLCISSTVREAGSTGCARELMWPLNNKWWQLADKLPNLFAPWWDCLEVCPSRLLPVVASCSVTHWLAFLPCCMTSPLLSLAFWDLYSNPGLRSTFGRTQMKTSFILHMKSVVCRIVTPQRCPHLNPWNLWNVTLHGKRDFADLITD